MENIYLSYTNYIRIKSKLIRCISGKVKGEKRKKERKHPFKY